MPDQLSRVNAALADRYQIERELGRGGMATVYLAQDLKHHRKVALKVLLPKLAAVLGADRFLNEIRVTANLHHPNIVQLYDSGEADGNLFYVMPFVDGESLREKINRERQLPVEEAISITCAVAEALDHAHGRGVIHRDIKPGNILLHEGTPMVADFGIALAADLVAGDRITETGLSLGTPQYMSPEQATGDREPRPTTDVYALGSVLYEMLVGDPPFTGSNLHAVIAKVIAEKPMMLRAVRDEVPEHVEAAVHRALAKVPADRFGSATAFANALVAQASFTSEPGRRARLPLKWGIAAGVLLMIGIVLGGWWTVLGPKSEQPLGSVTAVSSMQGEGIAVLPFRIVGPDLDLWREGLVDVLSTNLDGLGGLRKIDPRVILAGWRREVGEERDAPDVRTALEVARLSGARYGLLGSLIGSQQTVRLSVDVYDVETGEQRGTAWFENSPDSLMLLASQATLRVLEFVGGSSVRVADFLPRLPSRSGLALREYLLGDQEARDFRWREALVHYQAAAEADSSFFLALYKASVAHDWLFVASSTPNPYLDRALRYADSLPEREAFLLRGHVQRTTGQPKSISTLRALVSRFPDDVMGWYELGEAIFHLGPLALNSPSAAADAFQRTLDRDPGFLTVYAHLFHDAFVREDSAAVVELIQRHRTTDTTSTTLAAAELAADLAWGDSIARAAALNRLEPADDWTLAGVGMIAMSAPVLRDGAAGLFERFRQDELRWDRALTEAHHGRPDSAWAAASSSPAGAESSTMEAAQRLILHVSGMPTQHDVRSTAALLETFEHSEMRFLLGALAAQQKQWHLVDREIELLSPNAVQGDSGISTANSARFARALRGYALAKRGDDEGALQAIEEVLPELPGVGPYWAGYFAHAVLRREVGRILLAAGRPADARRYFESLTYPYFHIDVASAEACLGEAYERMGNRDLAARHYERFVRWWENGQPEYRALAEAGRRALERVAAPTPSRSDDGGLCARLLR